MLKRNFGYYDSKSEGNLPELASLMASEFHETWWTAAMFSDSRKEYEDKRIGSPEVPLKLNYRNLFCSIKNILRIILKKSNC